MALVHPCMGREPGTLVVLVRGDAELARWTLAGAAAPDLSTVEELARLQLAARRLGCSIRVLRPGTELAELLELCGLSDVLAGSAGLCREVGGQAEDAEEPGVEEVVVPDDPPA